MGGGVHVNVKALLIHSDIHQGLPILSSSGLRGEAPGGVPVEAP